MPLSRHPLEAESLLTQTRGLLRRFDLRARKGLGQHFLVDEEVLKGIITAARLTPTDIVLEIGPGLGILTRDLARQAGRVIAIELDNRLAAILKQTLSSFNNVTIVNEDVLKVAPEALLGEAGVERPAVSYKVVANLPYYITSPVLRHFLEAQVKPQTMVVMVQKEVAEEIVARPGRMSLLSVSVQLYGQPEIMDYVPARCFYPAPEVDSALLRITTHLKPAVAVEDVKSFFALVRAGFSAARKQLANSLSQGLAIPKPEVCVLLAGANIAPQRRAETLSLAEWICLWRTFCRRGEPC